MEISGVLGTANLYQIQSASQTTATEEAEETALEEYLEELQDEAMTSLLGSLSSTNAEGVGDLVDLMA